MSDSVSGYGSITIPVVQVADACQALLELLATQRGDYQQEPENSNDIVSVLEACLNWFEYIGIHSELEGDSIVLDLTLEGVSFSGSESPIAEDRFFEVLAPFVESGYITWEGEDNEKWIYRYWDGGIVCAYGVVTYPDSPCEEDH